MGPNTCSPDLAWAQIVTVKQTGAPRLMQMATTPTARLMTKTA